MVTLIPSVNYSDFLNITLSYNIKILNDIIVVTDCNDSKTIQICNNFKIKCITCNCCYCEFDKKKVKDVSKLINKAKLLNQGLMYIYENYPNEWYLILDADIILNDNFEINDLNSQYIYGCKRYCIETLEDFKNKVLNKDWKNYYKTEFKTNTNEHMMGLGFFQLFKSHKFFNQDFYNMSEVDLDFAKKFKIACLDYSVLHLGLPGKNWWGRITESWQI